MPGVLVSYRRDDSQGFAGCLADDLSDQFGEDKVFRDIEIPVGSDFTDVLHRAIAASDVLLVVIGRHWLAETGNGQASRLFEPTDWVRTEIEAAFAQGKQVIPALVGNAVMPSPEALPQSIRRLARVQAASLSDRHWDSDVRQLAARLRAICPSLAHDRPRDADRRDSPAEVMRELGQKVFDELGARRRPRIGPPSLPTTLTWRALCNLGRGLRKLVTVVVVIALIYVGIRLFGDESMLSTLDAFEARLQIGWERLQRYLAGL